MLEALTYGLMLKPQLLTVTMKVMQILGEVLTMTEADDLDPGRNAIPALYNSLPGSRSTHTGFPSKTGVRDMQSPSELPHVVQVRIMCGVVLFYSSRAAGAVLVVVLSEYPVVSSYKPTGSLVALSRVVRIQRENGFCRHEHVELPFAPSLVS